MKECLKLLLKDVIINIESVRISLCDVEVSLLMFLTLLTSQVGNNFEKHLIKPKQSKSILNRYSLHVN